MSRVYVPVSREELAAYLEAGLVPGSNEYVVAEDESEDAEYEALEAAAADARDRLDGPGRRYVIVAEAGIEGGEIPWRLVHAVHADTEDVDPAADALPELAWFATQEIPDLIG